MSTESKRIQLIDAARGVAILAMLVHHFLLSFGMVFPKVPLPLVNEPYFEPLHFFFVAVFLLISGICSHFSRNNIRRGLIVLAAALVVSAVTFVVLPESPIYFGILHLLGCCMVLYGLLSRFLEKLPTLPAAVLFLVAFLIYSYFFATAPRIATPHLYILGFPDYRFSSADYFPLLPWLFLFLFGTVLGRPIAAHKLPRWFYETKVPVLAPIGRHTLLIYLLHQPVFLALLYLVRALLPQ